MFRYRWIDISKNKTYKTVPLPLASPSTRARGGALRYMDESLSDIDDDERISSEAVGHFERIELYSERRNLREPIFDRDRALHGPHGQMAKDAHEFDIKNVKIEQMVRWVTKPGQYDIFWWVLLQANIDGLRVEFREVLLPMEDADLRAMELNDALKLKQKRLGITRPVLPAPKMPIYVKPKRPEAVEPVGV